MWLGLVYFIVCFRVIKATYTLSLYIERPLWWKNRSCHFTSLKSKALERTRFTEEYIEFLIVIVWKIDWSKETSG